MANIHAYQMIDGYMRENIAAATEQIKGWSQQL